MKSHFVESLLVVRLILQPIQNEMNDLIVLVPETI